ncbi:type II secretion system protein N [Saccharospirillum mangrovi]|uniref:type II secretion system protein N n=1 Tax=Saccharospirillum mangrovi TaxID=2161747 RepID=UPI000D37EF57|nr:type II secretion system protein N [Saccharospirillum mangrovi]
MNWARWQSQALKAQQWLVLILVAVSAVLCARLTWLLLDGPVPVVVPRIEPATTAAGNASSDLEALGRELAEKPLFGTYVAEQEAVVAAPVDAPDTQLRLVLQAVVARGNEGQGFAVIAQRNGQSDAFSIGDNVFGQAELAAVYGDRVLLNRNGRMETLRYERSESNSTLQPLDRNESGTAQLQSANVNQVASQSAAVQQQVEQMVSYVRERAASDPQGLLNEVGLEASENGYRVTRRARQLQMAGLRPGDVVTAVNDNPVGNLAQDQALLNQILQSGGELKIAIQRGSRTFTIYQSIPTF